MTRIKISEAIGNLSDRHVDEVLNFNGRKRAPLYTKFLSAAVCVCLCATIGLAAWRSGAFDVTTGDGGGFSVGGDKSAFVLSKKTPEIYGEGFTDSDIAEYIESEREFIVFALQKEYDFEIKSIAIHKKGYSHVSLGDGNRVNLDAITLPILVNGEMYASVSMVRADGEWVKTLNLGGDNWKNYNAVLFESPTTEVAFAYLPEAMGEIMILPDNEFVNPAVGAVRTKFGSEVDVDVYELLKTEHNTVSASELTDENNLAVIYEAE